MLAMRLFFACARPTRDITVRGVFRNHAPERATRYFLEHFQDKRPDRRVPPLSLPKNFIYIFHYLDIKSLIAAPDSGVHFA